MANDPSQVNTNSDSSMAGKTGLVKQYGYYVAIAIIVGVAIKALLGY